LEADTFVGNLTKEANHLKTYSLDNRIAVSNEIYQSVSAEEESIAGA